MREPAENDAYISTDQAARALGVGVSTIKRWVDEGRLPAHRTAGGHRKLLRAEVLALAREGDLPRRDITGLMVAAGRRGSLPVEPLRSALLSSLLAGDGSAVQLLIRRAYRSGLPLETLADRVIAPAMERVGHDWESARIDVWHEHRGTQLCVAALHQLFAEVGARARRDPPMAVGCAPAGDPYQLSSLLAQLVLIDAGWNAVNLGPNTPFASLTRAVEELRPRLVWLSVSHLSDPPSFLREYGAFYRRAAALDIAVAIGGRGLTSDLRSAMPYASYGDGLTHLAAFARTIAPPPRRPRRGRPRSQKT